MNILSKWTLTALSVALLAGCGSSTDKAKELVKAMDVETQYRSIVMMTASGYSRKYPELQSSQIKKVIEDNLPKDLIQDSLVEVYAEHFTADELDLIIKANKNPQQAMAIIMGSKDGQALALKSVKVQGQLQQDIAKALEGVDEDIVDDLDDLKDEAKG